MTYLTGAERNIAPADFQERLTLIGGVNRYDEPLFKLVWAQYETFVAGGIWSVDEQYFKGYRRLLLGSGEPCWTLLQWHAAEEYGAPEAYYVMNYDETSGLQNLGEYPYSGRYEVLYNLRWHEMIDNQLTFRTMPLNNSIFSVVATIVKIAKSISIEKTRAAYLEARAQEEAAKLGDVERHLRERALPFNGAVSYGRQGIRSTIIDQKMLQMQRVWNDLARKAASMPTGLSTQ